MNKHGFSLETKGESMGDVSRIFLLYCFAFISGLLIAMAAAAVH
jgi:hypothetical protein